jgi:hypothetical protein
MIDPDPIIEGDEYYVCDYDPVAETGGTPWAGLMVYGLAHEDTAPVGEIGAIGFWESRNWSLVSCDRNDDGSWDNKDYDDPLNPYYPEQGDWLTRLLVDDCETPGGFCEVVGETDKVVECTTGNCRYEIVTTLLVNLDLLCDRVMDGGLPLDNKGNLMLCFYAEGRTPTVAQQALSNYSWTLPLQARLGPVGGDKTVNFKVEGVTAVELAAFDAAAQDNGVMLAWETATELDNVGFNIYRADSQVGEMNKINASLILSKDPGSTAGATYSFLDESVVPGVTYYYWLEDVDVSGAVEMNGPVAVKMGVARALPGRPRPAPMPSNAF